MPSPRSRRSVLAALGAAAAGSLAGCTATTADDPPAPGTDSPPNPDDHVYGADGEWSSFGCNASNTRTVADGKAPVDGVAERWRDEVPQLGVISEPVVAGGRVYLAAARRLRVYDAADGTRLWTKANVDQPPLVRGGTAYVPSQDRLLALDPETGEAKWTRSFDATSVRSPSTYAGDWLYVPAGETIHRLDAETGETDWSRRLFGRLLGSPPIASGHWIALATEAGKLYFLDGDGTGAGEWSFPAVPQAPPTADTDGVYVNCLDGTTRGITTENAPRLNVDWRAETGWNNGGLAVERYLYAAGTDGLRALDPETGEERWQFDTGDWRWTAPALARDTLFVGGDALYALDPTPKGGPLGDGPAVRFEKSFHGRVGPGPVVDDGVLYVVAQTGESSYHLLALE